MRAVRYVPAVGSGWLFRVDSQPYVSALMGQLRRYRSCTFESSPRLRRRYRGWSVSGWLSGTSGRGCGWIWIFTILLLPFKHLQGRGLSCVFCSSVREKKSEWCWTSKSRAARKGGQRVVVSAQETRHLDEIAGLRRFSECGKRRRGQLA